MNTGITTLSKLSEVTTMYPFAGFEYLFAAIVGVFFVVFIAKQISMDEKMHEEMLDHTAEAIPSPAE